MCSSVCFWDVYWEKKESGIKPLPDKLLTVGLEAKEILRDYGNYTRNMVDAGFALRYEYLERFNPKKIQRYDFIGFRW